jgi:hypothetical protein
MAINQETQNANGVHLCSSARPGPLCYSQMPTSNAIDHARIDARNSATLAILTAVTCVAAFLVVYGGWGL